MKTDIPEKAASLNIFSRLEEEGIGFEVDDLIHIVLDCLQFSYDFEEELRNSSIVVNIRNESSQISDELLSDILFLGKELINKTDLNLEKKIYRYTDIAYSNNMCEVLHWWASLLDPKFRTESNFDDSFRSMGQPKIIDEGEIHAKKYVYFSFPFLHPNTIVFKKYNYNIFNSDEDVVNINRETQRNSLVLTVSLDKPAHNIDDILEEFRSRFCLLQASSNWNLLQSGKLPNFDSPESKSFDSIIKERVKHNKLIKRYDSILKLLAGLCCYDRFLECNNIDEATGLFQI
ncbi:MAG: hypothetical protein ACR65R_01775 [Methylomicrobium sp.]